MYPDHVTGCPVTVIRNDAARKTLPRQTVPDIHF